MLLMVASLDTVASRGEPSRQDAYTFEKSSHFPVENKLK